MRRTPLTISLAASLIACAALAKDAGALPPLPDLTSYAFVRGNTALSPDQAAEALKDYDVIFFGEWHDHPGNHLAEMALFRALHKQAPQLSLSMEQFERDVQPVLDDYAVGKIGEEIMRRRTRAWSNYAESYRPLVEYARENKLPLIAANAPNSVVRCVGQDGPEFLPRISPEKRGWAAAELHLLEGAYRDKFMRFLSEDNGHGQGPALDANGVPTPAAMRSYASQSIRDDTMAESIFLHVQKNPGRKVVHITGAFHVESALGTVERLKLRAPNLKIAVIAPAEAENPEHPAVAAGDIASGDFLLLLRGLPKSYASDEEKKAAMTLPPGAARANRPACTL